MRKVNRKSNIQGYSDRSGRLPIAVTAEVPSLRDGAIELTLNWTAKQGTAEPMRVFVHFLDADGKIVFQADHDAPVATTDWRGASATSCTVLLPDGARPGDTFDVRAGLYTTAEGRRALITGAREGERSVHLGVLALTGTSDTVTGIAWTPPEPDPGPDPHLARRNPDGKPITFGPLNTDGAVRMAHDSDDITVRPLPESPTFTVRIQWEKLPWQLPAPTRVDSIGPDGQVLRSEAVVKDGDTVVLTCTPDVFEYRLSP